MLWSQGIKSSPGSVPLFHFATTSPNTASLWDSHPTYVQFKSLLLDFFRGVEMDAVSLKGLERVISVTIGGDAAADSADAQTDVERAVAAKGKEVESLIGGGRQKGSGGDYEEEKGLPLVHFRTYTLSFLRSGLPTPLVALSPHGPHLTFEMRRTQQPSAEMWKAALKKTVKKVASGNKKNKNIDGASVLFPLLDPPANPFSDSAVDEMGDKVGRVYVDSQDLSTLQSRKFKGLKRGPPADVAPAPEGEGMDVGEVVAKVSSGGGGEGRKRPKVAKE